METSEQIEKFKDFIESEYEVDLHEAIRTGKKSLVLSFNKLSKFDIELAELLLQEPEEIIRAAELSLDHFDLPEKYRLNIRFVDLPNTQRIKIGDIRSENLGKLLVIQGIVRQASDVRPQVTNAKFECPSCGNTMSILQVDTKFKEPTRCSCGRRGKFRLLSKDLVDAQRLVIEEAPESLEGGEQPKRLGVFLKDDLVEPKMEKRTTPGSKTDVIGVVKESPIFLKTGVQSIRYELSMEVNYIVPVQEDYSNVELNMEDIKKIKEFAKDKNAFNKFVNSIAPSIYGHEKIKEALVLQMFGGFRKVRVDNTVTRGDIHILLVGDPGAGKSQILQFISKAAPKARFVSGKGSTSAGLTASVVKDEFLRGYSLEAGAMVLANRGIACLHPSTQVIINNKVSSIENLYKKEIEKEYYSNIEKVFVNDIDFNVLSLDKNNFSIFNTNSTKIRRKLYNGDLLNIKFNSGFNLLLTPDHKLINGSSLEWNESSMFKKGDYVLAPLKLNLNTKDILFLDILPDNWKVGLKKEEKGELKRHISKKFSNLSKFNRRFGIDKNYLSGGKQFKIFKFKEILKYLEIYDSWKYRRFTFIRNKKGERLLTYKLTPELSYIFGFVFGDGNFNSSKRRSRFNITQSKVNSKFIDELNKCAVSVFGKEFGKHGRISSSIIRDREVISYNYILYHNSNLLCELIRDIIGNKFENILTLPDECLKAFIAGLFDSDGCSSIKNSLKSSRNYKVQYINILLSNCRQLNLNLMLALRRFDVYSKLNEGKNILNLEITGRIDVHQLLNSIKKYSIKAQNSELIPKLTNISSVSDKLPQEVIAKISKNISKLNKGMLLKKGIWSYIYYYANSKIQPSRDQLNKFVDRVGDFILEDDKNLINNLLRRDIFIDKIIDINKVPYKGHVYDLFVPLTNNFIANGIVVHNCIDELDKMGAEDRSALHQALEQQTISISKANIQATLMAQTTLLAAANPKFGRFDPYTSIASQIDLPSTLINRFDLIFPIRDIPNKLLDEKIAQHVLELPLKPDLLRTEVSVDFLRKYIAYAKQSVFPSMSEAAIDEIKNFYVSLRSSSSGGEERVKPIPISPRQLEALVRLAEASARVRLSDSVTRIDARRAINLLKHCLMQVGFDPETGQIDIDRISSGITASIRGKILIVKEIIDELSAGEVRAIPIQQIINLAAERGIEESSVEEVIDKLKKSGDIFEPRRDLIQKV